jgi:hydrogenase/urease accessory protein HupE
VAAAVLAFVVGPAPGHAHLVQTGFGSFYDGLAHLFVTPTDLLVVLAVALLAGAQGAGAARAVLVVLPLAWLVAGAAGVVSDSTATLPWATTLIFAGVGLLVALATPLARPWVIGLAILAGVVHGFVNGATMTRGDGRALALLGAVTAVFALVPLLTAVVVSARREWMRVGVRVAGSWIAAIGLLMIGWLVAGQRAAASGGDARASDVGPAAGVGQVADAGQAADVGTGADLRRFRGQVVWGHEVRTFQACGSSEILWMRLGPVTGAAVRRAKEELSDEPYEPIYGEIIGRVLPRSDEGFAASADGQIEVERFEVLGAWHEGRCGDAVSQSDGAGASP